MGFSEGAAEDAADMLAWMESYDLKGLEALNLGLDYMLADNPETIPGVLYQDADLAVIDGHGQSVLRSSSLALELGYAKARARGLSVIKIRHCRQRQLMLGYLARLAGRGINVTAFWRNEQRPLTEQVVGFLANSAVPEIRVYSVTDVPDENEPNNAVTLVMANHVNLLPAMRSEYTYDLLARHDESDLLASHARVSANGVEVDDLMWSRLQALASRLLVETSDASRRGAGPDDHM